MAKGKLQAALDAHKGKDYHLEKQKILRKQARKKKRDGGAVTKNGVDSVDYHMNGDAEDWSGIGNGEREQGQEKNGLAANGEQSGDSSSEMGEEDLGGIDISHIDDSDSDSELDDAEDENDLFANGHNAEDLEQPNEDMEDDSDDDGSDENGEEEEDDEDIPLSELSDLSSTAKEDIIPHQRLTINNTSALLKSLRSIALPTSSMTFSEHQSLTSEAPIDIPDINDDLNRELAFYAQSLDAVKRARSLLKAEAIPFSRPPDFFAEMVKSDEHMGRIKHKLVDEASRKKAASEARKLRDLKKFGKQVQVAKLQERDRAKRDMLDKVLMLKKKRKDAPTTEDVHENEDDDMFDIGVEAGPSSTVRRASGGAKARTDTDRRSNGKRQKRDQKFGFGGKKRFSKSTDAMSSGDLSGFNKGSRDRGSGAIKKKGQAGKKRLGKSRRSNVR